MESLITDGQYLVNERAKTRAMQGKTKGKEVKPDIVVSGWFFLLIFHVGDIIFSTLAYEKSCIGVDQLHKPGGCLS